jgi:putative nucleotidyltransferase with HDIG domain
MNSKRARLSIFSQRSDRIALLTYLLGAVVPLAALAYFVTRYVIPGVDEPLMQYGVLGAILSIGVLSLGSFMALSKSNQRVLAGLSRDRERLSTLIKASHALAGANHGWEVMQLAADYANRLTDAQAAYLLAEREKGGPLDVAEKAGDGAAELWDGHRAVFDEVGELVTEHLRPVERGAETSGGGSQAGPRLASATGVPIITPNSALGVLVVAHCGDRDPAGQGESQALLTLAGLVSVALQNAELQDAQRNFFTHVTEILLGALDSHMDHHTGHSMRVAHLSNQIARELGFDETRLQRLHFAALLHDLGMLKIDPALAGNRKVMEKHTTIGFRMLSRIKVWEELAPLVLYHHEWYDGSGYPEGLVGDAIPIESRIIAVADAFDAMTSTVSYKEAISVEAALSEIEEGAGTQFDPLVARTIIDIAREGRIQLAAQR